MQRIIKELTEDYITLYDLNNLVKGKSNIYRTGAGRGSSILVLDKNDYSWRWLNLENKNVLSRGFSSIYEAVEKSIENGYKCYLYENIIIK